MRRPLLIIFIISLVISFIYTNKSNKNEYSYNNRYVSISGTSKDIKKKERYNEYIIGDFIVRDFKNKNIPIGYKVNIKGELQELDNLKIDEFDYGRYLKSNGYKGIILLDNYEVHGKNYLYYYSFKFRSYLIDEFRNLYKGHSPLIIAINLGIKDDLDDYTMDLFSKTGTAHIMALSGLNIGIICSIVCFIIRNINRFYKLIILISILFFFSFMVGFGPSIVRACVFAVLLFSAIFLQRCYDGISSLSIIGTWLIILNPYVIYNASFQLSFLATLSIIYFYNYINSYIKFPLISLTIAANILTLPIMYYSFKSISLVSLICNLLVVPCISIIMILSMLSIITLNISMFITNILVYINKFIINYIFVVLNYFYNLTYSFIEFKESSFKIVVLYYIIVFTYMIYKELTIIKEQKNGIQGYS
jgi:competence protein ComEC